MGWNHLSIPNLRRLHCWIMGMDWWFHPILHWACDYSSILKFKLIHVNKMPPATFRIDWPLDYLNGNQFVLYVVIFRRNLNLAQNIHIVDNGLYCWMSTLLGPRGIWESLKCRFDLSPYITASTSNIRSNNCPNLIVMTSWHGHAHCKRIYRQYA